MTIAIQNVLNFSRESPWNCSGFLGPIRAGVGVSTTFFKQNKWRDTHLDHKSASEMVQIKHVKNAKEAKA